MAKGIRRFLKLDPDSIVGKKNAALKEAAGLGPEGESVASKKKRKKAEKDYGADVVER